VIIHFSFEELQALRTGAAVVLDRFPLGQGTVAAPPRERVQVQALAAQLQGDLSLGTLAEQQRVEMALRTIARTFLDQLNDEIRASHPASEPAVASYFEYAHTRAVLDRVTDAGAHMRALIEIVTGAPPSAEVAESFSFSD